MDRVLVVGGGIAGLMVASSLRNRGVDCELVERAERWAPVGAGIVLSVNAMAVLRGIGLDETLVSAGQILGHGAITDARGNDLGASDFGALQTKFGPTVAIHRAALHEALLAAAGTTPISLDTSVDHVESDSTGARVRFTDGREERYDLVVGADGLRSQVRSLVFGERAIVYSGYTCWRFVVPSPSDHVYMREMWGRGQRFGIVPIGGGRVYCFAVANAPAGQPDPSPGRLERFRERFSGFGGDVPAILGALTRDEELIHNDLEEVADGSWVSGRVVLVGDAAHAMTPNMGQGAAMALEDAAVLVESLTNHATVDRALVEYESRRKPRVRWVQNQSRRIGRLGQLEWGPLCALRDAVLKLVPDRAAADALRKLASQPL
jgi:2-polyprenyl-6-methoxyphenol hydroxylase-like FAD-dependent oxidoreductase